MKSLIPLEGYGYRGGRVRGSEAQRLRARGCGTGEDGAKRRDQQLQTFQIGSEHGLDTGPGDEALGPAERLVPLQDPIPGKVRE